MFEVIANSGLALSGLPAYLRWRQATRNVARAQARVLKRLLVQNAGTAFGRMYDFASIKSVDDYRKRVPLATSEDLAPYVQRIAGGEANVLTHDPVRLLEPSSGTASPSKLVPYTNALRSEFQAGVGAWLWRTYGAHPGLLLGKQYWSVTPASQHTSRTEGGIPIGFEDESQYFGPVKRRLVSALLAVPPAVRQIEDIDSFRYATLRFLLQEPDLRLISVWNPTFLMLLLAALPQWANALVEDVQGGTLTPPGRLAQGQLAQLTPFLRREPERAGMLTKLLTVWTGEPTWQDQQGRSIFELIWPKVELVSCWADGAAASQYQALREWLPNTRFQPKGLLATEAFVSFPSAELPAPALSLLSHFFEFCPGSSDGTSTLLAHELKPGGIYSVAVSTGGGFYRYRLRDLVQVAGYTGQCPLLRFIGKEDMVVDIVGEKLHEVHVAQVVEDALARLGLEPRFWMLAPGQQNGLATHYTLFIHPPVDDHGQAAEYEERLLSLVDQGLQENFHYRYARRLGQLHAVRLFLIDPRMDASSRYLIRCAEIGQRLGNIKTVRLHADREWATAFTSN